MKMQQESIDQMLTLGHDGTDFGADSSGYESSGGPATGDMKKIELAIQRLGQKVNNNAKLVCMCVNVLCELMNVLCVHVCECFV